MDEAQINPWGTSGFKTWMNPKRPVHVRINPNKTPVGITGAITSHKQAFYYVQQKGTTLQNVIGVIDQVPLPNPRRTVLVMDNHNVHRTQELQDYVNGKGISILMLPPSSSSLNPVGKLFSSNGANVTNLFFFRQSTAGRT